MQKKSTKERYIYIYILGDLAEGEICGHTQLVQRFKELQRSMLNYVKTRHANGVRWNPNGSPLRQAP